MLIVWIILLMTNICDLPKEWTQDLEERAFMCVSRLLACESILFTTYIRKENLTTFLTQVLASFWTFIDHAVLNLVHEA